MPPIFRPEACPRCGTPFAFGYAVRRAATMPWMGRLILMVSLTAGLMLSAMSLLVLAPLVWSFTEKTDLPYQDKGMLFFLAYVLIGLPLSLAPAYLGWRSAFGMPRVMRVRCPGPDCGWVGKCRVLEQGKPAMPAGEQFQPLPADRRLQP